MALEREHKFLVESTFPDVALLRNAYGQRGLELRLSAPREQHDVYYDTSTLALLRAGVALRVRRFGDETLATYKASGEVQGSLHAREELELPYSAPWPPEILAKLTPLGVLGELEPLVQLEARRVRYLIYGSENAGALAELSLDEVRSLHGERQIAFRELELEAHPTLSDRAFSDLASVLQGLGLTPHTGDKLTRALTLLGLLETPPS